MSVEAGAETGPAPVAHASGPTPGELLRLERERRGFSVQQAAEDLHLDAWLVEAIEANRFVALGAPVYAKGHLRKYALLLGLSPELILERYHALAGTPAEPTPIPATVVTPVPRRSIDVRWPLGITAGVIVILVIAWAVKALLSPQAPGAAIPLVPEREAPAPAPTPAPALEAPAVTAPPTTAVASQPTPSAATPAPPPPSQSTPPLRTATLAAAPEGATAGATQLRLEFSEPSWTEVYDATGNRLLFDMGTPQRARTVSGEAPLRVILGMASAVTAQVNGRPIEVPQREGRDGVRFLVDASGVVRR